MSVDAPDPSLAPATLRVYGTAWRFFTRWCEKRGCASLPATPQAVADYLGDRAARGVTYSTLRAAAAAIRHHHEAMDHDSPTLSLLVRRKLGDLRNRPGKTPARPSAHVSGITARDFNKIQKTACRPRAGHTGRTESKEAARSRGAVDIAMISTMRSALLRGTEAVGLTWADLAFMPDGTVQLTIRPPGPARTEEVAVLRIGRRAAAPLKKIRTERTDAARVFGLTSVKALGNRIKAAAKAAELDGVYGAASPRFGRLQDLAEAGRPEAEIRRRARLKVPTSLAALRPAVRN